MIATRRARLLGVGAPALAGLLFGFAPAQAAPGSAEEVCEFPRLVASSSPRAYEGTGGGTVAFFFTVTTGGCDHEATVSYKTVSGTAGASDYTTTSNTLHWNAGDMTSRTIVVPVARDSADENNETFSVVFTEVSGFVDAVDSAKAEILDDDGALSWNIDDVTCPEGDAPTKTCTYRVSVSQAQGAVQKVRVSTSATTATAGVDYDILNNQESTLSVGTTSTTGTLTIRGDNLCEANETLTLLVMSVTAGTAVDDDAVATIEEDDYFCEP